MLSQKLSSKSFKPSFSGHETFPFRYGWLKKGITESNARKPGQAFDLFRDSSAIATFGVGKNMVTSIRYWLLAIGLIQESNRELTVSEFGQWLFGEDGQDPYLESKDSLLLLHWKLCGIGSIDSPYHRATSWYLMFNHYPELIFDKHDAVDFLEEMIERYQWKKTSRTSLSRDIDCLLRMYVQHNDDYINEDSLDSPMGELSLLYKISDRKQFGFKVGVKPTLSKRVFYYALMDFWSNFTENRSLPIESLLYEPGSPGRAFKLDKPAMMELIDSVASDTNGAIDWTQTAGLSQLTLKKKNFEAMTAFNLLKESRRGEVHV